MWPSSGDDPSLEIGYAALASRTVVRTISAGPPDGPPVLLLHGWACSAFLFRYNLPALASAGYRAIAVDLKGHGLSDKPERDGEYTLDAMAHHVLEILDALALPAAAIVGQSMGGRIALEVASRAPSRVSRLVLIAPVGVGIVQPHRLLRLAGWRLLEPLGPRLVSPALVRLALGFVWGRRGQVTAAAVEGYYAPMQYRELPRVLQRVLREFAWAPVSAEELERVRTPILLIVGSRDGVVRIAREHPLLDRRSGLDLLVVEDAGHIPNEECPDEVNAALIAFLDRGRDDLVARSPAGA